jgi:hypothetical protein
MDRDSTTEQTFPSTTWGWRHVRLWERPTPPQQAQPPKALPRRLRGRDRKAPITITVQYTAGAQCWYRITARGEVFSVPGDRAIHDVMEYINAAHSPRGRSVPPDTSIASE